MDEAMHAQCACGAVELALRGAPIVRIACYCDTCQDGSRRIEALPNAPAVRDPFGGTEYVTYRKDRVVFAKGSELIKDEKLEPNSKTNRVVASCCNSAIMMRFDDARHWVPVYRARLGLDAPAIEMRVCTSYLANAEVLPNDVPAYRDYPPALMMQLLSSRLAMLFGR